MGEREDWVVQSANLSFWEPRMASESLWGEKQGEKCEGKRDLYTRSWKILEKQTEYCCTNVTKMSREYIQNIKIKNSD